MTEYHRGYQQGYKDLKEQIKKAKTDIVMTAEFFKNTDKHEKADGLLRASEIIDKWLRG